MTGARGDAGPAGGSGPSAGRTLADVFPDVADTAVLAADRASIFEGLDLDSLGTGRLAARMFDVFPVVAAPGVLAAVRTLADLDVAWPARDAMDAVRVSPFEGLDLDRLGTGGLAASFVEGLGTGGLAASFVEGLGAWRAGEILAAVDDVGLPEAGDLRDAFMQL